MIQNILRVTRKKFLLFASVLFTGLFSFLSFLLNHSSKDDSLFAPTASADIAPWTGTDAMTMCADSSCSSGGCSGGGCFTDSTLVAIPNGKKEIQNIVEGDIVVGFDSKTLQVGQHKVLKTMKHSWDEVHMNSPLIIITHEKGILKVTKNHPLYRKGFSCEGAEDFCEAGAFSVGDTLTLENGDTSKIVSIEDGPEYDFVYNLEVEDVHTYIAGGVRVHA
jgi:hypothetical protein